MLLFSPVLCVSGFRVGSPGRGDVVGHGEGPCGGGGGGGEDGGVGLRNECGAWGREPPPLFFFLTSK